MITKELIEDAKAAGFDVTERGTIIAPEDNEMYGGSYSVGEELAKFAELQRQRERQAVPSGINFGAIVDALEAISNDIRPEVEYLSKLIYEYAGHIDAAQSRHEAEREALANDAARYRLLRSMTWDAGVMCVVVEPKENLRLGSYCPSQQLLDEALDALLSDSGSQG
jgi:hypothetical protein